MSWTKFDKDDNSTWPPQSKDIIIYDGKRVRVAKFHCFEINGKIYDTDFRVFKSHPQSREKISIDIESKYITHWTILPAPPIS
jgi:hypothetical protein